MCIYKKLKRVSITFCLLFISNVFLAQSISVSGTITDESNEGMPGVTVKEINGKANGMPLSSFQMSLTLEKQTKKCSKQFKNKAQTRFRGSKKMCPSIFGK